MGGKTPAASLPVDLALVSRRANFVTWWSSGKKTWRRKTHNFVSLYSFLVLYEFWVPCHSICPEKAGIFVRSAECPVNGREWDHVRSVYPCSASRFLACTRTIIALRSAGSVRSAGAAKYCLSRLVSLLCTITLHVLSFDVTARTITPVRIACLTLPLPFVFDSAQKSHP